MKAVRGSERFREYWLSDRDRQLHLRELPRLLDARLLAPSICVWAFTFIWILSGSGAALLSLGFLAAATALLPLTKNSAPISWRFRLQPLLGVMMLCLLLTCIQGALITARGYQERWDFLDAANGQGVRFSGSVLASSPSAYGGSLTQVRIGDLEYRGQILGQSLTLSIFTDSRFEAGSEVTGVGTLTVDGSYYRVKGGLYSQSADVSPPPMYGHKTMVRERVVQEVGRDAAGLLLGMAYGDDSSLSAEAVNRMRVAGLTHLTAVSGANISLVFVVSYRLAQKIRISRYALVLIGLISATLYVGLVGLDGSVLRAWVMGILGGLGMVLGHGAHRVAALCTCLLVLLVLSPELASNYGFALSVIATASLLFLAPALRRLASKFLPGILADVIAIPLSAALWCAPVILLLSDAVYPYTVLANVLVAPMVAPLTFVGLLLLIGATLGPWASFLASFLFWAGELLAGSVHAVASWVTHLPASSVALPASPQTMAGITTLVALFSAGIIIADSRLNRPPPVRQPILSQQGSRK